MDANEKLKESVKFQIRRNSTDLFKNFLLILEDIQFDYNLPPEIYNKYRKRVLDQANDKLREIETILETLNITFKG